MKVLFLILAFTCSVFGETLPEKFVTAAMGQINVTKGYDGAYKKIAYPMGDVPISSGVCTDVIIRALRTVGMDLQELIHKDMRCNFKKYPQTWGMKNTDKNIDHRRVPNQETYFKRMGYQLKTTNIADFKTGDIITFNLGPMTHIGIFYRDKDKTYLIHNVGEGAKCENVFTNPFYSIRKAFRIWPE